MTTKRKMKLVHSPSEIPDFASEDEEHAFGATHEFSEKLLRDAEPFLSDELPPARAKGAPQPAEG